MGTSGLGPFDNDSALDFVDEFLEVESPARSIREAIAHLDKDSYHEADAVYEAWAACELVAIAASGGEGYDVDDPAYEAAARLRPNRKLLDQCLASLEYILDEHSELAELVDEEQRAAIETNLDQTRTRLKQGLTLKKFPRLKVPKIKAKHAYAVEASGRWLIVLYDYTYLTVLDPVLDEKPQSVEADLLGSAAVLFVCRCFGLVDASISLGRVRPPKELIDACVFVTTTRHSCMGGSYNANFETSYRRYRGRQSAQQRYEDVRSEPFCPELKPEQFAKIVETYVAKGTLDLPPVPTPTELRDKFLARCRGEWSRFLEGDGGGPFSFTLHQSDISYMIVPWLQLHLQSDWQNRGYCLPDDLFKYFLAGVVAVYVGAYPEDKVPEELMNALNQAKPQIGQPQIESAIHILNRVLDENSVIPRVLLDDPPRRAAFLKEAREIRDALSEVRNRGV